MRIVHLTHYFLPESRGGTQHYVAGTARIQSQLGHDVHLVTGSPSLAGSGEPESDTWNGLPVLRVKRRSEEMFAGDMGSPRLLQLIAEHVAALEPDICHVHHWQAMSHGLVGALKEKGLKVVVTLHDLFTTCMRYFRMPDARAMCSDSVTFEDCAACVAEDLPHRSLEEIATFAQERFARFQAELSAADLVLSVSRAQKAFLEGIPGFAFNGIEAAPIGIPRAAVAASKASELSVKRPLKLVGWGGIEPRKGMHLLLDAIRRTGRGDQFELHLYGAPSSSDYAAELLEAGDGTGLFMHGPYEDEDLSAIIAGHDLAVFPFTAFETYALSVDEALHGGIPLLVSDRGAPSERVGDRGRTFPVGDVGALAGLLSELLDQPELLRTLRAGRHHAHFLEDHVEHLLGRYSAL